jgi:hypothetical protein
MTESSTNSLPSAVVLAAVIVSTIGVATAEARGGGAFATYGYQKRNAAALEMQAQKRKQSACVDGGRCVTQPPVVVPHAEPGTFWRLVSPCDWLEGTGVSCFLDPYEVDDNN